MTSEQINLAVSRMCFYSLGAERKKSGGSNVSLASTYKYHNVYPATYHVGEEEPRVREL